MDEAFQSVLRVLIRGAAVGRKAWWFVLRPDTKGAQMLVVDEQERVLLVRHTYARRFLRIPGGGCKRNETLADCALREVREETGIIVPAGVPALQLLGVYAGNVSGTGRVAVFVAPPGTWQQKSGDHISHAYELCQAEFFPLDGLPSDVSPGTERRLGEYRSGLRSLSRRW